MQANIKLITSLVSLSFFLNLGFIPNSNIVIKNNNEPMKNQVSISSSNEVFKMEKDNVNEHKEISKEDGTSSASKKQEMNKETSNENKNDVLNSSSKEDIKNTGVLSPDNTSKKEDNTFIDKVINKNATKLVDLGWVKYIVVTFNEGTIKDYDLYVLDGENYKPIKSSKVDDNGKIVKWEIDKLGYNTIKVKNKNGDEGTYKFIK